jgi:cell division protein FtsZ
MGLILSETLLIDFKNIISNNDNIFIGSSVASGNNRAEKAIKKALLSPLHKGATITNSEHIVVLISIGLEEITLDEISEISDYIQKESTNQPNIILNVTEDNNLENAIGIIIIATGFKSKINLSEIPNS